MDTVAMKGCSELESFLSLELWPLLLICTLTLLLSFRNRTCHCHESPFMKNHVELYLKQLKVKSNAMVDRLNEAFSLHMEVLESKLARFEALTSKTEDSESLTEPSKVMGTCFKETISAQLSFSEKDLEYEKTALKHNLSNQNEAFMDVLDMQKEVLTMLLVQQREMMEESFTSLKDHLKRELQAAVDKMETFHAQATNRTEETLLESPTVADITEAVHISVNTAVEATLKSNLRTELQEAKEAIWKGERESHTALEASQNQLKASQKRITELEESITHCKTSNLELMEANRRILKVQEDEKQDYTARNSGRGAYERLITFLKL
ncbi:hypothetical protein BJ508DRAFT_371413 [Ascobolus immersus RN42]|uniref:Uncharacterized protein n=1 Tax=Ascobolus immersus RN42 TaxID=1160509 RepID=A0A3N4INZ4_ASCIM|nr:hypothetical protein BJ508DRAFT_371413 [Ascobolus immersus RN42]